MNVILLKHIADQQGTPRRNSVFVSFYFRNEGQQENLIKDFQKVMSLPAYHGSVFDFYKDDVHRFREGYYSQLVVPGAKDSLVLQIGLNSTDRAEIAWKEIRLYLANTLEGWYKGLDKDQLLGYTIVYKSDLSPELIDESSTLSSEITSILHPLFAEGEPMVIAKDVLPDGLLFLVDTEAGDNALVYCLLGDGRFTETDGRRQWNQVVPRVVYGRGAILLFPDCLYHKSRFLRTQIDVAQFNLAVHGIHEYTRDILDRIARKEYNGLENTIEELSRQYNKVAGLQSMIKTLTLSAGQQRYNFQTIFELNHSKVLESMRILYINISSDVEHLEGLEKKSQLAIDRTKETLDFVRAIGNERSSGRLARYQNYVAIVGVVLASLQIIDNTFAKQLWNGLLPVKYVIKEERDFFAGVVLVRLICSLIVTGLAISVYRWIARNRNASK